MLAAGFVQGRAERRDLFRGDQESVVLVEVPGCDLDRPRLAGPAGEEVRSWSLHRGGLKLGPLAGDGHDLLLEQVQAFLDRPERQIEEAVLGFHPAAAQAE